MPVLEGIVGGGGGGFDEVVERPASVVCELGEEGLSLSFGERAHGWEWLKGGICRVD